MKVLNGSLLLLGLLWVAPAYAQNTFCFTYPGGVISCDSSQSSTQIVPLGHGNTIITTTPRYQPPVEREKPRRETERRSYERDTWTPAPSRPREPSYEQKYGPTKMYDEEP